MILFGWGHSKVKDAGPVTEHECPNCKNTNLWHLIKASTWFTLFFIPVFPYSIKRFIICPTCQYGESVSKQEYETLVPVAHANKQLQAGSITQEEYNHLIAASKQQ